MTTTATLPTRWHGELAAAATTLLVQMPFDAIYGTIAFAALDPAYAPLAVASALFGSVVAHVVALLAGSRHLVIGPRPATTLLVAGLVAALLAHPALRGPDGRPELMLLLSLVALGIVMAGVLQIVFGLLRLGELTKYLPYPVRVGFLNGIGALLVLGGLRLLIGQPAGPDPSEWPSLLHTVRHGLPWGALAVGGVTIAATLWPPRWRRLAPPGPLVGLLAGIALHQLLLAAWPAVTLSATLGAVAPQPTFGLFADWARFVVEAPLRGLTTTLLGFAAAVALLATLDTVLVMSVMDGVLRTRRDSNRELIRQGLATIASALVGGQPTAPAVSRALIHWRAGGHRAVSIWCYAGMVAAVVWGVPGLLHLIPKSALGGALIVAGLQLIDPWSRRVPGQLLRRASREALDAAQRRTLIENYAVMLLVAATVIVIGLAQGLVVGMLAAMILFVRSNSRALVRSSARGDLRRSVKVRGPQATAALARDGRRIALLELEGMVFFGTADELLARAHELAPTIDFLVLGLHRVTEIDSTGARALLQVADDLAASGKWLLLAELDARDPRAQTIAAMAHSAGDAAIEQTHAPGLRFEPDIDIALQWAEDHLLQRLGVEHPSARPLSLAETVLGTDLVPADLAWLASAMTELRFAAGEVLFRAGDAGDALYVSLLGEIAVLLPGGNGRRLASLAPGIVVGELALLHRAPRSADAVAESALTVLRLDCATFDRMRTERPALWDQLMRNLTLHLSARLRSVTIELAAALAP